MFDSRLASRQKTREKRRKQIIVSRELKLQPKKSQRKKLDRLFVEAKWFYNYLVEDVDRVFKNATYRKKKVPVRYPDGVREQELKYLSGQMKQEMMKILRANLKALKTQKQKGQKIGKLSFVSERNAVPLVQPGVTFKFVNNAKTKLHIQKLGRIRALGGKTLQPCIEIAYAVLIKKPDGYYVKLVGYVFPEDFWRLRKHKERFDKPIAIDFGVKNKLTLSNGVFIDFEINESERLKNLQRRLTKEKSRKRINKLRKLIRREYLRLKNVRKDVQNKLIGILYRYKNLVIQDEQIKSWHSGLFGKQVQHSAIGGITARIRDIPDSLATPKVDVVPANVRTTRVCSECGSKVELTLNDRTFICPHCGFSTDRDLNATYALLKYVGLDRPESKMLMPVEKQVYERNFNQLPFVYLQFHEESHML